MPKPHTALPRQLTVEEAVLLGYIPARILASGECAGVMHMLYTCDLFVGLSAFYRIRYSYANYLDACEALFEWDGKGDPPGPWIKKIGEENGKAVEIYRTEKPTDN